MYTKEEIKNMKYRELERAFFKLLNSMDLFTIEKKDEAYKEMHWIENRMRGFEI